MTEPLPMILTCPSCCGRHVDKGEFATKPHHTHACQHCGMVWRPALIPTVGVQFLPGFKDDPGNALTATLAEQQANAALIAAAPDLYEVANTAPILSQYHGAVGFEVERFIADYELWRLELWRLKARAALARARGE